MGVFVGVRVGVLVGGAITVRMVRTWFTLISPHLASMVAPPTASPLTVTDFTSFAPPTRVSHGLATVVLPLFSKESDTLV